MLPFPAQKRLRDAMPEQLVICHEGRKLGYRPAITWAHEDRDPDIEERSIIQLELDPTGIQRDANTPVNDRIGFRRSSDPTIAYTDVQGSRMYDVLNITVAAQGESSASWMTNSITAAERAGIFSRQIYRFFRFQFDQNHQGENDGEIPVLAEPISGRGPTNVSDMFEDSLTAQFDFGFELRYVMTHGIDVDSVDQFGVGAEQTDEVGTDEEYSNYLPDPE